MMNITKNMNGTELTIAVEGRMDTLTAPEFRKVVENELDGVTDLIIDLKQLGFISSAGLRAILIAEKKMSGSGTIKVVNVNPDIEEVFEITGMEDLIAEA